MGRAGMSAEKADVASADEASKIDARMVIRIGCPPICVVCPPADASGDEKERPQDYIPH